MSKSTPLIQCYKDDNGKKEYDVVVYQLTYCKIDTATGDYLRDDDGKVIEFYVPDEDCSYMADGVNIDELKTTARMNNA
jgi:hypothetical protein